MASCTAPGDLFATATCTECTVASPSASITAGVASESPCTFACSASSPRRGVGHRFESPGQRDERRLELAGGRHLDRQLQLRGKRVARESERFEHVGGVDDEPLEGHIEAVDKGLRGGPQHLLGRIGKRRVEAELLASEVGGGEVLDHATHERGHALPVPEGAGEGCEQCVVVGDITGRPTRARDLECTHAQRGIDVLVATPRAAVPELDPSAAHLYRTAITAVVPVHAHVVAAELDRWIAPFEQVHHREMGDDPGRVDSARLDASKPDVAGRPLLRIVAHRVRQHVEQLVATEGLTDLVEEVSRPGGVAQHLNGLETGDVVEEPAAGRVHEHEVPLRLEECAGPGRAPRGSHPSRTGSAKSETVVAPSTTDTYSSRALHGSTRTSAPRRSNTSAP